MDAIERGHAEIFEPGGDTLVGGQHEFLDQPVGPCALGVGDAAHLALLVEFDDGFGQIEIDAAALFAALVHQDRPSSRMRSKFGDELCIALARLGVAFEDGVNVGVRHALGGTDDAFDNFETLDAALGARVA